MTRPTPDKTPDKMSWGTDSKTAVEVPTNQSQKRLKALAKPGLGWGDDANTAVAPGNAIIPAAAYRDPPPALEAPIEPSASDDDALPASEPPTPSSEGIATKPALPVRKRAPNRRRWLLLGLTMLTFYVATYVTVSVVRKLEHHAANRESGAQSLSVWAACREVLDDVRLELAKRLER